ncbi:unnamed protein product [Penicillium roqueforti FM164]|uniref:Genomic scaffold, ProqFM164S03 n=1 Tax=Penicillium roqueforti (strain FM164) TaxID=1365484 RepID=W6QAE4_PENRF|nr:unnamed protein product [Penicillium roqueforti FM164]
MGPDLSLTTSTTLRQCQAQQCSRSSGRLDGQITSKSGVVGRASCFQYLD